MMTELTLAGRQKARLWFIAWQGLHAMDRQPPVSPDLVEQLLAVLPERLPDETLGSWLKRANPPKPGEVIAFPGKSRRFQPVTEFFRLAADSGDERYPLPEKTLESADGRFWLTIRKIGDDLELTVQALGMAIDEFAGCTVGVAAADDPDALLAIIPLDQQGEGYVLVTDTAVARRRLLHPTVGLLAAGDA